MRTALFPGSFNPFTSGHQNLVQRALQLFDKVIIALGDNSNKQAGNSEACANAIRALYQHNPAVEVVVYHSLTADLVKQYQACCIIRGIRNESDLAYENEIAQVNFSIFGVETVYLLADPALKEISSSLVRELERYGKDVSQLLPQTPTI